MDIPPASTVAPGAGPTAGARTVPPPGLPPGAPPGPGAPVPTANAVPPGAASTLKPHPMSRWLTFGIPLLVTLGLWSLAWIFAGQRVAIEIFTAITASLFALGTSVVLGPAVLPGITLTPWNLALLLAYMNSVSAFVYAYNLDLLERIPRLGDFLRRVRLGAHETLKSHPWIRRMAMVGVTVFVLLPLPGSGSLGGCMVGLLLGLGAFRTFISVALAGCLVSYAYAAFGSALQGWLDRGGVSTEFRIAGAVVTLALVWLLVRLLKSLAAKAPPEAAEPSPETDV